MGGLAFLAGRRDADGFGRAHKFAKLAAHAFGRAFLIAHKIRRAAEAGRHSPKFLGIAECGFEFVVFVFVFVNF